MTFVFFQNANQVVDRFFDLLARHGIAPAAKSKMESELLSVTELLYEVEKDPDVTPRSGAESILRTAAGMHDFAAKVLSIENITEFRQFVPHLKLINETKFPRASIIQNAKDGGLDDVARKIAELYIACLAAHVGTDVTIDDPSRAKGNNPDVLFMLHQDGPGMQPKRWGLAIKTISSTQGQTIYERIKDGAAQINSQKCPADIGMVVVNAKNALNHDALWDPDVPFPTLQTALDALNDQLDQLADSAAKARLPADWDDVFNGKVVRPVIFMGQSLVRVPTIAHQQTPTPIKVLKVFNANGVCDPVGIALAAHMNEHMQRILHGNPGGPGILPS